MIVGGSAFADRYGPWALIAGASDGVGEAFAHTLAHMGLNVVLLARRQAVLDDVAASIQAKTGRQTRAVAIDLSTEDAFEQVRDATAGLEIGMVVYCAGADPNYERFLAGPVEVPLAMVHRNCVVPMQVCHHFAGQMQSRGRGGIVLVSSAGGLHGGVNMVAYSATKAFDIMMAESLWAELHPHGVDVLSLILGVTDTPALRRLLTSRGVLPDESTPPPGAVTPQAVVTEAMENLTNGPTWIVGEQGREAERMLGSMTRSDAVKLIMAHTSAVMGSDDIDHRHPEPATTDTLPRS